jgi:hypothetical protein
VRHSKFVGQCLSWVNRFTSTRRGRPRNVRFTPIAPEHSRRSETSLRAISGLMHRSKTAYSITSSARSKKVSGIVRPSALAIVRLMMRSNLVGCSIGILPGFVPRKILST